MEDNPLKIRIERQKICSGCGKELDASVELDENLRAYCSQCRQLGRVKENWMPLSAGYSISSVFVVKNK